MEEIWKDIEGYEGLYQVSNLGRVKSLEHYRKNGANGYIQKGKILKTFIDHTGYEIVTLCNTSKKNPRCKLRVHRLVAQAFIPIVRNKSEVNHIDGNKLNNSIDNLEWCTQQENMTHRYEILKQKKPTPWIGKKGKEVPSSKKVIQFDMQGNQIAEYESASEATEKIIGKRIGSLISMVCRGERKTAYGYIWKYKK